jgi:hypothetical protein
MLKQNLKAQIFHTFLFVGFIAWTEKRTYPDSYGIFDNNTIA